MIVNLPNPPISAGRFLQNLVARLTDAFRRIRPASGWKDKEAPLSSAKVTGASQPTWSVFRDSIYAYKFSATATNEVWITFHLPHDMQLSYTTEDGTRTAPKLYPHVHWASDGVDTGTVRFGFEYTYAKGYTTQVFPASTTIYVEQASDGVTYKHNIAEADDSTAITDADFEVDGLLLMRVFRDGSHANDTLTDDVWIFTVDMHYLSDGLETIERNRGTGTVPWHKQSVI